MAFSFGARCAQGVLITFNLLFWMSGIALIYVGIFILAAEEKSILFPLFQPEGGFTDLQYLASAFIGIGCLVLIVGFFGCWGALHAHQPMLVTYFVFLFIILGAEMSVGIMAEVFQRKHAALLEGKLKQALKEQYGVDPKITKAINLAQTKFQCCGIVDSSDYAESTWQKNEDRVRLAPTCCVLSNADDVYAYRDPQPVNHTLCQGESPSNHKFRHQTGCFSYLDEYLRAESTLFVAIGCGIASLEIFGMIFAICQCREIREV